MPSISVFFGIIIRMFYNDHTKGSRGSSTSTATCSSVPSTREQPFASSEWAVLHRSELEENRRLAKARQPLRQIAPLEWERCQMTILPGVVRAEYRGDYRIHLTFQYHERTEQGRLDEAVAAARKAAALRPEVEEPALWEGLAHARAGRGAKARLALRRFLAGSRTQHQQTALVQTARVYLERLGG